MKEEKNLTLKGEKRRDAIIEASLQLFSLHGYENTSLQMIITQSGGSRRMIYSEFGGKEGLLYAVLANCSNILSEPLRSVALANTNIEKSLQMIGEALITNLLSPQRIGFYRMLVKESQRFPEFGVQFLKYGPGMTYQLLGDYLDKQVNNGNLNLKDTRAAATLFIELCKSDMFLEALFTPNFVIDKNKIKHSIKNSVTIFLDGCRR